MGVLASARAFNGIFRAASRSRLFTFEYAQRRDLSGSVSKHHDNESVLPVLIVGAGPVGLVLSIFLTKLGTLLTPFYAFVLFDSYFMLLFDINLASETGRNEIALLFSFSVAAGNVFKSFQCTMYFCRGEMCRIGEEQELFYTSTSTLYQQPIHGGHISFSLEICFNRLFLEAG